MLAASLHQLFKLLIRRCWLEVHIFEKNLEGFKCDEGLTHAHSLKRRPHIKELLSSEHFFDGDVLDSEVCPVLFGTLHSPLKNTCWVYKLQFVD